MDVLSPGIGQKKALIKRLQNYVKNKQRKKSISNKSSILFSAPKNKQSKNSKDCKVYNPIVDKSEVKEKLDFWQKTVSFENNR